jgi:putative spermidine/putrescine transport system ATP-binding protein
MCGARESDRGRRDMTPFLRVDQLTRRFGPIVAVDGVSLSIERGEILALLGPSGSGKTTTLRLLAGFELPDAGHILVEGQEVSRVPAAGRRFGMVFQHYALFPHLDVGQNVAFGLESLGVRGGELERRIAAALALVDLAGFERRRVSELSGGQQQRVALARALAPEPRVLLLDEPLSNLDPTLRERTRREIRAVVRRVGITTIIVTHEQEEAFDLGDRIAVLRAGRLIQVGTPDELYRAPANEFVAGFVGRSCAMSGDLVEAGPGEARVLVEGAVWRLPPAPGLPAGAVRITVRPEGLRLIEPGPARLRARVVDRRFAGAQALFTLSTEQGTTLELLAEPEAVAVGALVAVEPTGGGIHLFSPDGG